jgi:hypothetical protein
MEQTQNIDEPDLPLGAYTVPWNLVVPEADIHLVGYGNRLPNDFTLEMLAVLQRCKRIFGLPPLHAPEFSIPPMESLMELYAPDRSRWQTYREMADRVLDAAGEDPPIAFATHGSALVGVYLAHAILEEAPARGLTVHVTNSVSCFDGLWADLNWDPFFGFEVWEATGFLKLKIEPNTSANLLLPQAPFLNVETGMDPHKMTIEGSSSISELRDHLLRFYPADHVVHFVRTSAGTGPHMLGADIESLALGDLDGPGRDVFSTLVVPRGKKLRGRVDFASPALAAAAVSEPAA